MRELSNELKMMQIELDCKKNVDHIPKKALINIKNIAEGKYTNKFELNTILSKFDSAGDNPIFFGLRLKNYHKCLV